MCSWDSVALIGKLDHNLNPSVALVQGCWTVWDLIVKTGVSDLSPIYSNVEMGDNFKHVHID